MSDDDEKNDDLPPDTNAPWRRSSVLKVSISPKDFVITMTTQRRGSVPVVHLAGGPAREAMAEDNERTTRYSLSGDLGLEIHRQADGQGIEYEQDSGDDDDKNHPWSELVAPIMSILGGAVQARGMQRGTITPFPQGPPFADAPFPGAQVAPDPEYAASIIAPSLEDQTMFGASARDVVRLRTEVSRRGDEIPADIIATIIMQVAGQHRAGPQFGAHALFTQARWSRLVEALLPDASEARRASIVAALEKFTDRKEAA